MFRIFVKNVPLLKMVPEETCLMVVSIHLDTGDPVSMAPLSMYSMHFSYPNIPEIVPSSAMIGRVLTPVFLVISIAFVTVVFSLIDPAGYRFRFFIF